MTHRFQVAVLFLAAASVRANTITVNTTADGVGANDGFCTLREAILAANTNTASGAMAGECAAGAAGLDTIEFAIPGAGVKTITPVAPLPAITEALFINGYTQGVASPNTNALDAGINAVLLIEVDLVNAGVWRINAAGSVIRGLNIHGFGDDIQITASNVTIAGNFIGTNPAGTAGFFSNGVGITMLSGDNNVVGGVAAADRNLVSGFRGGSIALDTDSGTLIQGNYIGTNVTGTLRRAVRDPDCREGRLLQLHDHPADRIGRPAGLSGGGRAPARFDAQLEPGSDSGQNAIVGLGPSADITVHPDQAWGTVHLIIDVYGYFQ